MRKSFSLILLVVLGLSSVVPALKIEPVRASGTIYIRADGSIDPSTAPIQRNADTYTFTGNIYDSIVVERSSIIIDGNGYTLQGSGSGIGISLTNINYSTITNTNIKNFGCGIRLDTSFDNLVTDNSIAYCVRQGVLLLYACFNYICENDVTNTGPGPGVRSVGVSLTYSSNNNTIVDNNISDNTAYGIGLEYSCSYNIIAENMIANNGCGMRVYYSSENKIYHNNFNNTSQLNHAVPNYNVWDDGYPSGGNYWSDYSGTDSYRGPSQNETGSDGIGDTPYVVDADNRDRYPLMTQGSPGYYDTSEYLIGSIVVATIFLESNGTIDPSTENWNLAKIQNVVTARNQALNWWGSQNPNAAVSFICDADPRAGVVQSYIVASTSYEPITRPSTDDGLWISEAMTQLGYSGADYVGQTYAYLNNLRNQDGVLKYDWAFAIFAVESSNDPNGDGCFVDGLSAYAYGLGGPFIVTTYTNDDWGTVNLNRTIAHEVGHVFYATDEYDGVTEYSGYLNVSDIEGSGCVMDNNNWSLSAGTWGQVGWRDSDSDGIQDIVDTFPNTVLNPYSPDPTTNSTITYTGTVTEIPYPNTNPYGTGRDITINTIDRVEFRIDGGPWMDATTDDGAFDESEESFSFTTPPLSVGNHTIEARGMNSVGNVEMTYASDNVEIRILGDVNRDGVVDSTDLGILGGAWGSFIGDPNYLPEADINDDGVVDSSDLGIMGAHWGETE
jgi:parallel beta-helix repeat protein